MSKQNKRKSPFINYEKDSLAEIVKYEKKRLKRLVNELNKEEKLCGITGKKIISEFGFKGNIGAVRQQLLLLIERYSTEGFSDKERKEIVENQIKASIALQEAHNDNYKQDALKHMANGDFTKFMDALHNKLDRDGNLHEKKECICYTN